MGTEGRDVFSHTVATKERRRIAVDEKIIKKGDAHPYLRAAVDLEGERVIAAGATTGRRYPETLRVLGHVKRVCAGKLPRVFVDGGVWHPWACEGWISPTRWSVSAPGVPLNDSFHAWTGESDDSGKHFLPMPASGAWKGGVKPLPASQTFQGSAKVEGLLARYRLHPETFRK